MIGKNHFACFGAETYFLWALYVLNVTSGPLYHMSKVSFTRKIVMSITPKKTFHHIVQMAGLYYDYTATTLCENKVGPLHFHHRGWDYKNSPICLCLSVWVRGAYIMHHCNDAELCCAPLTRIVHYELSWIVHLVALGGPNTECKDLHLSTRYRVSWHPSTSLLVGYSILDPEGAEWKKIRMLRGAVCEKNKIRCCRESPG